MQRALWIFAAAGFLTACNGDSDGDGLSNKEEKELGTDPELADSDGDGLDDPSEIDAGTNPSDSDSDGDGLNDGDEIDVGSDPSEADSDGDGLNDGDEIDFGSDPLAEDADGDGLLDGDEKDAGTNPSEADSDGDGYLDPWELDEGSDPTDENSKIYQNGWAYNPEKDDMDGPSISSATNAVGELFPRIQFVDQFGETFDLYDFAGHGKPVILDISAIWCGPCNGLSSWISGQGDSYGFGDYWTEIEPMVQNGDIFWVTVLGEDLQGNPPDESEIAGWDEDYPAEMVPVLADDGTLNAKYIIYGWPSVYFIDEDMVIQAKPDGTSNGHYAALDMANDYEPSN